MSGQKQWKFIVYETDGSTVDFTITNSQLVEAPTIPTGRADFLGGRVESVSFNVEVGDFSGFVSTQLYDSDSRQQLLGRVVEAQINEAGAGFSTVWKGRWTGATESDGPGKYSVRLSDEHWAGRNSDIFVTQNTTQIYPNAPFGIKNNWGDVPGSGLGTLYGPGNAYAEVVSVGTYAVVLKIVGMGPAGSLTGTQNTVLQSVADWIKDDLKEGAYPYTVGASSTGSFEFLRCNVAGTDREILMFSNPDQSPNILSSLDDDPPTWPTFVSVVWHSSGKTVGDIVGINFTADGCPTSDVMPYHIGGRTGQDPIQLAKSLYDDAGVRYDSNIFSAYDSSTNPQGLVSHPDIPKMWWRITESAQLDDWLSANVYGPLGIVPFINRSGEIAPTFWFMPQGEDPSTYTEVNATNVASDGHPTWQHDGGKVITTIKRKYSRPISASRESSTAADFIKMDEQNLDDKTNDRQTVIGDKTHELNYSGIARKQLAEDISEHVSREIFDRYGDGLLSGSFKGLSSLNSVDAGDFVVIALDTFPNSTATGGRGGNRVVQIVGKTWSPGGPDFEFIDAGQKVQALTAPTLVIAKNTNQPTEAVDITISNLDADATQWKLQIRKGASGKWENFGVFDVADTSVSAYNLPSGTAIYARALVSAPLMIRSDWSATVSVTLDGLTAPSALSASVDGRSIELTWTNGESNVPVMPVIEAGSVSDPADALGDTLPAGTTEYVFSELDASQLYTVGVYHIDGRTGSESSKTTTTATTSSDNTLSAPRRLTILQGRPTSGTTPLPPDRDTVGEGLEIGFQPTEAHADIFVQVATDSLFSTVVSELTLPAGESTAKIKRLDLGTTYYVRIRHIRLGWTESSWSSTVSAKATRLLPEAPQNDNLAAGSVSLYVDGGVLKVRIDSQDKDTDKVYFEATKNPGSSPFYPSVDTSTTNSVTRANLPYDGNALDSGGSAINIVTGDSAYVTVGFYNNTYGFGSFVYDRIALDTGRSSPDVQVDATYSAGTASVDLTITDPELRVTAVEFQKKSTGTFGGTWLSSWDRSTGTTGTDASLTRGEDITSDGKHNAMLKYKITYTDDDGNSQTKGDIVVVDVSPDSVVTIQQISYKLDGTILVSLAGDGDTSDIYVTVSHADPASEPSDPTALDTALGAASGTLDTGVTAVIGDTVWVKARGVNSNGDLGPVTDAQDIFGTDVAGIADGAVTANKVSKQAQRFSTTVTFSATDSDTVQWTSGTVDFANGDSYSVVSGNTGNMTADTWVYFDPDVSTTILQTTTTRADIVAENRILMCTCWAASSSVSSAGFVPAIGVLGVNDAGLADGSISETHIQDDAISTPKLQALAITAAKIATGTITATQIASGTITASEIASNTITGTNINGTNLSSIFADLGTITAGYIQNSDNSFYIDLGASSTDPVLHHANFELLASGDATFSGTVSSTTFSTDSAQFGASGNDSVLIGGGPIGGYVSINGRTTGGGTATGASGELASGQDGIGLSCTTAGSTSGNVSLTPASGYSVIVNSDLNATGDVVAYYSSDRRLKEHVRPISGATEKLQAIRGVEFEWQKGYKPHLRGADIGVIAQEVREVIPSAVRERADGMLAVDYQRLIPLLLEAIRELDTRLSTQEAAVCSCDS